MTTVVAPIAPFDFPHGGGGAQQASYFGARASDVRTGQYGSGFIGGGQIGYNWQFWGGRLVAGVETDIQGVAGSGNSSKTLGTLAPVTVSRQPAKSYVGARSRPRSASIILAPCAVASAGCSPRPCSFTAPAVSPTAACRRALPFSMRMTVLCCSQLSAPSSAPRPSPTRASAGRRAPAWSGCSCRTGPPRSNIYITTWAL